MESAVFSSELWDETEKVTTAVTFHLPHQAQVPGARLGNSHLGTLRLASPSPDICSLDNQSLKTFKKNPHPQAIPMSSRAGGGKESIAHFMPRALSKPHSFAPPTAHATQAKSELGEGAMIVPELGSHHWSG